MVFTHVPTKVTIPVYAHSDAADAAFTSLPHNRRISEVIAVRHTMDVVSVSEELRSAQTRFLPATKNADHTWFM